MELNDPLIILTLLGLIIPIILALVNYIRNFQKRRKYQEEKEKTDKIFEERNYSFAIFQYEKIIQNLDYFDEFDQGEIFSKLGHCFLDNPEYTKKYGKIEEGKHYLERSLSCFDTKKKASVRFFFKIFAIIDYFNIFYILSRLNIKQYVVYANLTTSCKPFKYIFRFAGTLNDLGITYCRLAEIRRPIDNLQTALLHYYKALDIYKFERYPIDYVITYENIIITYQNLATITNSRYFSYLCGKISYEIYSKTQEYPELFEVKENSPENARVQLMAGNFLRSLFELNATIIDKNKILYACISCYQNALEFYTVEEYPYENSLINNNLGVAYIHLSFIENPLENIEKAKRCYIDSLQVRATDRYPIEYAQTVYNLGLLYQIESVRRKEKNEKISTLLDSIKEFKKSLSIRNISDHPREYAETQLEIGFSYLLLSQLIDKEKNILFAQVALTEAEKIIKSDTYSQLYSKLYRLKKQLNIEKS